MRQEKRKESKIKRIYFFPLLSNYFVISLLLVGTSLHSLLSPIGKGWMGGEVKLSHVCEGGNRHSWKKKCKAEMRFLRQIFVSFSCAFPLWDSSVKIMLCAWNDSSHPQVLTGHREGHQEKGMILPSAWFEREGSVEAWISAGWCLWLMGSN